MRLKVCRVEMSTGCRLSALPHVFLLHSFETRPWSACIRNRRKHLCHCVGSSPLPGVNLQPWRPTQKWLVVSSQTCSEPYAQRAARTVHYSLGSEKQDGIVPEASQSGVVTPFRCSCVASREQRRICLHQLARIDSSGGGGRQCWPLLVPGACWEHLANTGGCPEMHLGGGDTELRPWRVSSFLALRKQVSD